MKTWCSPHALHDAERPRAPPYRKTRREFDGPHALDSTISPREQCETWIVEGTVEMNFQPSGATVTRRGHADSTAALSNLITDRQRQARRAVHSLGVSAEKRCADGLDADRVLVDLHETMLRLCCR